MPSDYFAGSFMCMQSMLVVSLFCQSLNGISPKFFFTVFCSVEQGIPSSMILIFMEVVHRMLQPCSNDTM